MNFRLLNPQVVLPHPQDKLLNDPSSCSLSELVSLIDNYVGETRSKAWAEIDRRDKQPTLAQLIDGLRLEWVDGKAETEFGTYRIWDESDEDGEDWAAECDGNDHWWENYDTRVQAVGACLNHYKQRVRAIFDQLKGA